MKTKILSACACVATLGAFSPALSQIKMPKDEIIVSSVKFDATPDQVGRAFTIIDSEEIIKRQQRFLADALTASPGLHLIRSGGVGTITSVSLRGIPSAQTLVVVDGIAINNPSAFGNSFNFANFDTSDIERIEVLRGPQSALFGSHAVGGVINIISKSGHEGTSGDVYAEGGSFGTVRGSASLRGGSDKLTARASISGVTTDGISAAAEENGNTEDDGYSNITYSTRLDYQHSDDTSLIASVRYSDSSADFDGFSFVTFLPTDADNVAKSEEFLASIGGNFALFDGALKNQVSAHFASTDQENTESDVLSFDAVGKRRAYRYQGEITPTTFLSLIAGVDYEEQDSTVRVGFGGTDSLETISGYGLAQVTPAEGITLSAGVRHDSTSGLSGVTQTDDTTFSASGVLHVPGTPALLRASFTEGFRTPSVGELSLNDTLQSESSQGWDVGIEAPLFDDRLAVKVAYFNQDIDNLIGFDPVFFIPVNVEAFKSQGVEATFTAVPCDWLSINAGYTFTDAGNESTTLAAGLQPRHKARAEFDVTPIDQWSLSVEVVYNGEEELFGSIVEDYVLLNVRTSYALRDGLEVFGRVENATDKEYVDNPGFGTHSLAGYGGLRLSF